MPTVQPMPDLEAVCSQALRTAGLRAYASLPKKPQYPVLTVNRLGGLPVVREKLDAARIQIDSWGGSKGEARDLADEARQIIYGLEGTTNPTQSATVTGVADEMGLMYLQDPDTNRDRYTFTLTVYGYSTL